MGLFLLSTTAERINDFPNAGCLQYTVDTVLQIPYGDHPESLGNPRMPYFGPRAFDVNWEKQIYFLFEEHDKTLRSYDDKGSLIYKKEIDYPVFDLGVYDENLYVFDGSSINVYKSTNGDILTKIDIAPLVKKTIRFSNVSFFYERYLILGDFDLNKWRNDLCYIFDLKTNRLSNNLESTKGFLPITKCPNCKHELVQRIVNDTANDPAMGSFVFNGQSDKFLIFAYYSGREFSYQNPTSKADIYVFSKEKGTIKKLRDFKFLPAGSTTPKRFMFVNDTTAVFAVVNYDKDKKRFRPLVLNKLTFHSF